MSNSLTFKDLINLDLSDTDFKDGKLLFASCCIARNPKTTLARIENDWMNWEMGFLDKEEWEQAAKLLLDFKEVQP